MVASASFDLCRVTKRKLERRGRMNIFYIIGVIVVILVILSFLGLR